MLKSRFPISAVFAITLVKEGFVLIHDANKPGEKLWKNIGGRLEKPLDDDLEVELEGIVREFEEETKKKLPRGKFKEFFVVDVERGKYSILFYITEVPEISISELQKGDEVEDMKIFSKRELEDMLSMKKIVWSHARALDQYLKTLPF